MSEFGREVVALLDHLEIPQAVVMGTSLGANATLEVASLAPERLRGMVVEMPVLDHALLGCAVAFTPLMLGADVRRARRCERWRAPRGWSRAGTCRGRRASSSTGWRQDPEPSAAVIQGLFFGRTAPPREERRTFEAPTLVIGHRYDASTRSATRACSPTSCRTGGCCRRARSSSCGSAPDRLTNEIAAFLDECWKPAAAPRRKRASA